MKTVFFTIRAAAIFSLLLLVGVQHINAQNKTWGAGPEIGISFSKLAGDLPKQQFNTGIVGGGHITYSTRPTFALTFKALYHQRGSQAELNNVVNKTGLQYLEFPLLARYFLTPSGKFRPNVFLGPSAGFLLNVKSKAGDADYVNVSATEREKYGRFDLGLTAGIGLNYLIGKETRLLLDSRYTLGLSDVYRPAPESWQNRGLAFTLGLSFGINKKPLK